ncbi:MAG: hypothetical protein ACR2FG_14930 [Marmoricola sp.]
MAERMVFEERHDENGSVTRAVRLLDDGSMRIEGHDLGPGVTRFFAGHSEYEFARTLPPASVAALVRALGIADGDLLPDLRSRFATTADLEAYVRERDIESELWSSLSG